MSAAAADPLEAGAGDDEPFALSGALPGPGMTVIEASAGTGKTFTLAGLATRFLAEGTDPEAILAVTFTRMATGELRERVRRRVASTEAALGGFLDHGTGPTDEVASLLTQGPRASVEDRRSRLSDAIAAFDGLTITTTHGFCQLVLAGLGSAGDLDAATTLLEDQGDLLGQVVSDLYLRWAERHRTRPPFDYAAAVAAAAAAVANPDAELVPSPEGDHLLSRLAFAARRRLAERLAEADLLTYDQVLTRLAATLADPGRGPAACERLRRRYRVVLVDEMQDTDPTQWEVLRRAFGGGDTVLVLIGDPKQAIYAFRGADVHAYLAAHRQARRFTLASNWRADQPLLDATEALLSPLQLGHPAIRFRPVRAPSHRQTGGLAGAPCDAPLRVRLVPDRHPEIPSTRSKGLLVKPELARWIAADVAGEIAALLGSSATVPGADAPRPVTPADVAVLTRTNAQAETVRAALREAGVPAVVAGDSSVIDSRAARDWLRLLDALQEPASRSGAVAAAGTLFIGWSATEIASAGEGRWEEVHDRLRRWSAVLAERGPAVLARTVTSDEGLPARLLAVEGGERVLTDSAHTAELLHAQAVAGHLGASALRAWLAARLEEARSPGGASPEERARRIDSDAEAVQVLTVHRAKGLEFGVVACPYLWDPGGSFGSDPVWFHTDDDGPRHLDVGGPSGDRKVQRAYSAERAKQEARGEDLRSLYVALTRARHQVVLWWARAFGANRSPLGRLLTSRDESGVVGPGDGKEPDAKRVRSALLPLAERSGGRLVVETAGLLGITPDGRRGASARSGGPGDTARPPGEQRSTATPPDDAGNDGDAGGADDAGGAGGAAGELLAGLELAAFGRSLDMRWRRASYSSIVAPVHGDPVGSEAEDPGVGDEPTSQEVSGPPVPALPDDPAEARPCPLGEVPRGAEVGTFVHRLLEEADFAAPDVATRIAAAATRADPSGRLAGDPGTLAEGLALAMATPLGPHLPEVTLGQVGRADRLDELQFELPLAGGDRPGGQLTVADLAGLLGEHLPPGDRLAGYPDRLADPALAGSLRGYLTGSLDLVWRHPGPSGGTWWVADYKTNWLGDDLDGHAPLTTWHYRPAALDAEMHRRHYPLQALLYTVALHRYLRWRLPGYDPEVNLGGVLYLFVRGMVGPDTPHFGGEPAGVWSWRPPTGLVPALSVLLGTGQRPGDRSDNRPARPDSRPARPAGTKRGARPAPGGRR